MASGVVSTGPQLMPDGWQPRGRGRRPRYDLTVVLSMITANPRKWLKVEMATEADIKSARRQLSALGLEVSVSGTTLYVRSK